MADGERIRESLQGPLDPTYLKQREQAGWKLVAVEWERGELSELATVVSNADPLGTAAVGSGAKAFVEWGRSLSAGR